MATYRLEVHDEDGARCALVIRDDGAVAARYDYGAGEDGRERALINARGAVERLNRVVLVDVVTSADGEYVVQTWWESLRGVDEKHATGEVSFAGQVIHTAGEPVGGLDREALHAHLLTMAKAWAERPDAAPADPAPTADAEAAGAGAWANKRRWRVNVYVEAPWATPTDVETVEVEAATQEEALALAAREQESYFGYSAVDIAAEQEAGEVDESGLAGCPYPYPPTA